MPLFVKKVLSIQRIQDFKCQRAVEVDAERNENANRSIHVLRVFLERWLVVRLIVGQARWFTCATRSACGRVRHEFPGQRVCLLFAHASVCPTSLGLWFFENVGGAC